MKNDIIVKRIWSAVLMVVLGIALILWRSAASDHIMIILAVGIMLVGIVGILQQYLNRDGKMLERILRSLLGVVFIALGIVILVEKDFFLDAAKYVIGGVTILYGIKDLILAIKEKKHWLKIALPALAIVLGLCIVLIRFSRMDTLFLLAGIAFIYVGLASLIAELKSGKAPAAKDKKE